MRSSWTCHGSGLVRQGRDYVAPMQDHGKTCDGPDGRFGHSVPIRDADCSRTTLERQPTNRPEMETCHRCPCTNSGNRSCIVAEIPSTAIWQSCSAPNPCCATTGSKEAKIGGLETPSGGMAGEGSKARTEVDAPQTVHRRRDSAPVPRLWTLCPAH